MRGFFDCETNGLLDELDTIHCIAIWTDDSHSPTLYEPNEIDKALEVLEQCDELIGHNITGFDLPALSKVYGWAPTHETLLTDTLVMSRLAFSDIADLDYRLKSFPRKLHGSHSLEAWGYRLKFHKGDFGDTTDWAKYTPEMGEYCVRDVEVTKMLHARVTSYLNQRVVEMKFNDFNCIEVEHEFSANLDLQMTRGIAFDTAAAVDLYAVLLEERDDIVAHLQTVVPPERLAMKTPAFYLDEENDKRYDRKKDAPAKRRWFLTAGPLKEKVIPFNPGSRDQIARFLRNKYDWKPDPAELTTTGKAEINEVILSRLPYSEAAPLSEFFTIQKRLGQLGEGPGSWLKKETNGRIHGRILHIGARTHRCAHFAPNLANVPSVIHAYGTECRSLFVPGPGYVMVGADLSGLELRMLAHYLTPYDDGAYAREVLSGDIHTHNQKAAGLPTRDQAKTFIYALLYGAGHERLGSIVYPLGSKMEKEKEGKRLKTKFFNALPAFKLLLRDVKAVVRKQGYITGLDGRAIPVHSLHTALNTLLQGAGAVVGKIWINFIHDGEFNGDEAGQVVYVHDEVQWEARPALADAVGEHICNAAIETGKALGLLIPLAAEYKVGNNWAETH